MDYRVATALLEETWAPESGFFWRLRFGEFDPAAAQRVLQTLSQIHTDADSVLPKRFVSVLWFMSQFVEWQLERIHERGGDSGQCKNLAMQLHAEIVRILGAP